MLEKSTSAQHQHPTASSSWGITRCLPDQAKALSAYRVVHDCTCSRASRATARRVVCPTGKACWSCISRCPLQFHLAMPAPAAHELFLGHQRLAVDAAGVTPPTRSGIFASVDRRPVREQHMSIFPMELPLEEATLRLIGFGKCDALRDAAWKIHLQGPRRLKSARRRQAVARLGLVQTAAYRFALGCDKLADRRQGGAEWWPFRGTNAG